MTGKKLQNQIENWLENRENRLEIRSFNPPFAEFRFDVVNYGLSINWV